jgi:hypothetical protein
MLNVLYPLGVGGDGLGEGNRYHSRRAAAQALRLMIDQIYRDHDEVVFVSDLPIADIGFCNSLLQEANLLAVHIRDDQTTPSKVIDYTLLGRYKKGEFSLSHDPEQDAMVMLEEARQAMKGWCKKRSMKM